MTDTEIQSAAAVPVADDPPGDDDGGGLIPFDQALTEMDWRQGEHVTIIGPTGQGKTTLALQLLDQRGYPLIIATKPRDKTMAKMKHKGWEIVDQFPGRKTKTIIWPKLVKPSDKYHQSAVVQHALEHAFVAGGYAILIDELAYVIDELKCKDEITQIWQQGRALGLSLVTCILRPSHIPLLAYDQATHIIMFRDNDERNLKRMGGLGHWSRDEIIAAVSTLKRHEFIMLNTRNGRMIRSKTNP